MGFIIWWIFVIDVLVYLIVKVVVLGMMCVYVCEFGVDGVCVNSVMLGFIVIR